MRTTRLAAAVLTAAALSTAPAALAEPRVLAQHDADRWEEAVELSAEGAEAAWTKVHEAEYNVPRGYSYSPTYTFGDRPAHVDGVKLELFVQRGDRCGAGVYALDVAHTADQIVGTRYFPNAAGEISLPDTKIYKMMVTLWQPTYARGICTLRISVKPHEGDTDPTDPTDPAGYELVGVANYAGGFRHRLSVELSGDKIVRFWARVPAHCAGLETLEAGTVSEGHYDVARVVDARRNIFEVNGGAGARASAINLSFNGPQGLVCDIPLYVLKARP